MVGTLSNDTLMWLLITSTYLIVRKFGVL